MRATVVLGLLMTLSAPAVGQKREPPPPPRYGVEADLEVYPQDTPKAALASVVKAIDARRFNYLAAQLADPDAVDKRVQELGGFDRYLKLVTRRFTDDPEAVRELRRFASEGEINESGDAATVSHKETKGRQVFLRKVGGRWFLEDRQKATK
ncbi:MAG TPA: hypothetical protein VGF55_19710 [Gemmataceae bacterium]|jgi:hypothetical protein